MADLKAISPSVCEAGPTSREREAGGGAPFIDRLFGKWGSQNGASDWSLLEFSGPGPL